MRDAARVDQVLAIVRDVWSRYPHMRLGQLLVNAVRPILRVTCSQLRTRYWCGSWRCWLDASDLRGTDETMPQPLLPRAR